MFQDRHKKNRLRSRLVAVLGVLPGLWFLVVTQTEFGQKITVRCGYWFVMLILMSFIWLFYAVFVRNIIIDAKYTKTHAHSLEEKSTAQVAIFSAMFESIFAIVIFVLSTAGFLLTDASCVLSKFVEAAPYH